MTAAARSSGIPWPPLIYIAAIVGAVALGLLFPLPWIAGPLSDILFAVGGLAILAVVALWVTAVRTMARAKTTLNPTGEPSHLVTNGPFAVTRNPLYLANTLLMIGVGLVSGIAWFILLAFIAAFATQKLAIEFEEKMLSTKFGKKYKDYAKRVRRWI
ncbi:isoprenylcysteine carboxyl methyltransferase [Mesorhizobium sp. Root157]|uniref:methyltransferase family protein n=1 Tax=Mesorhizobium sp. Root157 TaxID=1736477 RepID=UPI0006F87907|nr:isoprenylcysteine carboxylmethyltransferase family protein [Mesorhizobium sp. Root157]KQZ81910.1 isoprenylcysteine carboxyl methyltransferase [Mesorhizobium sp. Root157]